MNTTISRKSSLVLLFLVVGLHGLAQENMSLDGYLEKGAECLRSQKVNCQDDFKKAIDQALLSGNDSLLGKTYLSIAQVHSQGLDPNHHKLEYAKKGLEVIRNKGYNNLQFNLLIHVKEAYNNMEDPVMQELYSDSTVIFAKSTNDTSIICLALVKRSVDKTYSGKTDEGFKLLMDAKSLGEEYGNQDIINIIYNELAAAFGMNEDFKECRDYSEKARVGLLSTGDTLMAMYALTNWCNASSELGLSSDVIERLPLAIDYFDRHKPHLSMYPRAQLGKAYNNLQRSDEGLKVLHLAVNDATHYGNSYHEAFCNILISDCLRDKGNYKKALVYSTKAYEYQKGKDLSEENMTTLLKHSQALIANNKFQEAVPVLQELQQAKDTVYQEAKMKEIAEIQQQLEFEQKENQIFTQKSDIALLQKEKEVISNRNIALIISLLLASVIGFLLVKRKSTLVKLKEAEKETMHIELQSKRRELTSQALHLAQKNELLNSLKNDLISLKNSGSLDGVSDLSNKIKFDEQINNNWQQFTKAFTETNSTFIKNLTTNHKEVGKNDIRLAALLSMNLSSKEIANILNISDEGVKKARYRLRKKLGLQTEDNLTNYLSSI